jgi:hypothetical protein
VMVTGMTRRTRAPAKVSGPVGPAMVVRKELTRRCRSTNHRKSPADARSRNTDPTRAADAHRTCVFCARVIAATRASRTAAEPRTGARTGITPTLLPRSWLVVEARAETGTDTTSSATS